MKAILESLLKEALPTRWETKQVIRVLGADFFFASQRIRSGFTFLLQAGA